MQAAARGDPVPKFLEDAPRPMPETEMLISDWVVLSSCRSWSQSGTPLIIPWTAVDAYAARHGISGVAFAEFESAMAVCEAVYSEHVARHGGGTSR